MKNDDSDDWFERHWAATPESKLELIDGIRILATDSKLTALQGDVDGTPMVGDKINGMEVLNVGQDPVGATWTLQLRRV